MSEQIVGRSGRVYHLHPNGTPGTLREAVKQGIENGAQAYCSMKAGVPVPSLEEIITSSVHDFLSQKFTSAMIEASEEPIILSRLEGLWKRVKGNLS